MWKLLAVFCIVFIGEEALARPKIQEQQTDNPLRYPVLVEAISDFSRRLMTEMTQLNSDVNIVMSPLSISSVMGMLWLGAGGETRREIEQTCRFGDDTGRLFKYINYQAFSSPIGLREKGKADVMLANALFYEKSEKLKSEFMNNALEYHQADILGLNFKFSPEKSLKTINQWVHNKTRGVIKQLLSSNDVSVTTRAVLTNAIYFSGSWRYPFHTSATILDNFTTLSGNRVKVPTMHQEVRLRYMKKCQSSSGDLSAFGQICTRAEQPNVIEIPYANGKYVMIILVPNDDFSFKDIEENLENEYDSWRRGVVSGLIELCLPKFQMNFQSDLELSLRRLGITAAFQWSRANFENLSEDRLSFSKFIHKAAVVVDEKGTKAAASSASIAILRKASDLAYFKIDRSFLFFVEDTSTRAQLFAGRIIDPTKSNNVL
ncbi:serpin B6-like [Styela clava]